MKYLKKLGLSIGWSLLILFILTFLTTVFNYFNLLSDSLMSFIKIVIPIISLFIGGIMMGKSSLKKGWLEGLKLGLVFSILFFILSILFFKYTFHFNNLLYYIIIITSSILGSMVGINRKRI